MRSITFTLRPDATLAEMEEIIGQVRSMPGVHQAQSFSPGSQNASVRRLCYATIDEKADAGAILAMVSSMPEVEKAELPTDRFLS